MSFTPGPWTVGPHDLTSDHPTIRANGWTVGYVVGAVMGGTCEANARLIAAAPDLLIAARSALFALEEYEDGQNDHETLTLALLREAIAKAEGVEMSS